jgi:hypothetical protein
MKAEYFAIFYVLAMWVTSCAVVQVDTLEHCSMHTEAFGGVNYWREIDCTQIEGDVRVEKDTIIEEYLGE